MDAAAGPAGPPLEPLECVCFTLIIDDIVLPDGETHMEQLGGGGSQSLFGYQLVRPLVAADARPAAVGLSAGVGADLPPRVKAWLEGIGADTSALLVTEGRATPRAWQVFEADGRRTQVWRGKGDPCDELYAMLRPSLDSVPARFRAATNYHLGVHPLHPPMRLLAALRAAAAAAGGRLSVEPYTAAEERPSGEAVAALLGACDVFSPNEGEAASMVGPGTPEELAARLLELSPPGGADVVVVRCGPEGVVVRTQSRRSSSGSGSGSAAAADAAECEAWVVPAVADTRVVDVTGCGNAFCGGFLAALHHLGQQREAGRSLSTSSSSDVDAVAAAAAWGCAAASLMAEAHGVPQQPIPSLQGLALRRYRELLPRVRRLLPRVAASAAGPAAAAPVGAAVHSRTTTAASARGQGARPAAMAHGRSCLALPAPAASGANRARAPRRTAAHAVRPAAAAAAAACASCWRRSAARCAAVLL